MPQLGKAHQGSGLIGAEIPEVDIQAFILSKKLSPQKLMSMWTQEGGANQHEHKKILMVWTPQRPPMLKDLDFDVNVS